MLNIVFDTQVIINVNMGIRHVTWGLLNDSSYRHVGKTYHVSVTYKNGNNIFYYETGSAAQEMFEKIRDAMAKTRGQR